MSDDPYKPRTRLQLKSCLKITPPITPDLSAAPSPCNSGRTSPSMLSDSGSSVNSGGRKSVAFCSDDELEEIFWADEWDRTPAPATPKLSYQDILELKQLRLNVPPPLPRQTYTPPSSSRPTFPVSRFASAASHTPSKWKNRSEPSSNIDPAILPYLEAVPIRLLPLLPQSPVEPAPSPDAPDPHPQTPTPTASPEARPITKASSEPPELHISPPVPTSVSPPPQPKKQNFAFLPLLPVEDAPPVPPIPITPSAPTPPRRTFNMTFLPVNAAPDNEPSSLPVQDVSTINRAGADGGVGIPTHAPLPSSPVAGSGTDPSPDAGHLFPALSDTEVTSTPTMSTSDSPRPTSPSPLSLSLPNLSVLSSSLESDTDTETDTYTDTDGESDAPSTSTVASSLPSPPCDFEDDAPLLANLKLETDLVPPGYYPHIHREAEPGSYFPPVSSADIEPFPARIPAHVAAEEPLGLSSGPGQTPPLSVLYPSPRSQANPLLPLDTLSTSVHPSLPSSEDSENPASSDAGTISRTLHRLPLPPVSGPMFNGDSSLPGTPLSMSQALQRKIVLGALPSPSLVPPSPFELEPSTGVPSLKKQWITAENEVAEVAVPSADDVLDRLNHLRVSESSLPDATPKLGPATSVTPDDSPMLTLESIRATWDVRPNRAPKDLGSVGVVIGPSLSRRRSETLE